MSLIKCAECEKEISRQAKTCPNCGAPGRASQFGWGWLGLALIFFFAVGYLVPDEGPAIPPIQQVQSLPISPPERTEFQKANDEMKKLLIKFLNESMKDWPKPDK
jgi:hypothetical protein